MVHNYLDHVLNESNVIHRTHCTVYQATCFSSSSYSSSSSSWWTSWTVWLWAIQVRIQSHVIRVNPFWWCHAMYFLHRCDPGEGRDLQLRVAGWHHLLHGVDPPGRPIQLPLQLASFQGSCRRAQLFTLRQERNSEICQTSFHSAWSLINEIMPYSSQVS